VGSKKKKKSKLKQSSNVELINSHIDSLEIHITDMFTNLSGHGIKKETLKLLSDSMNNIIQISTVLGSLGYVVQNQGENGSESEDIDEVVVTVGEEGKLCGGSVRDDFHFGIPNNCGNCNKVISTFVALTNYGTCLDCFSLWLGTRNLKNMEGKS
jgi:hypothetical protein